ncbi:hypothetical protein SMG44B_20775 [Stenotrophomonas maltophilia]|nr:hypothetical protein BN1263460012 [Stenotrophomonas maltophilia]
MGPPAAPDWPTVASGGLLDLWALSIPPHLSRPQELEKWQSRLVSTVSVASGVTSCARRC